MDFVFKDLKVIYEKFNKLMEQNHRLESENVRLKKENDLLQNEVKRLKSELNSFREDKTFDLFAGIWEEKETKQSAIKKIDEMISSINTIIKGLKNG